MSERERERERKLESCSPRLPLTVNCTRWKVHENWKLETGKHARKVHNKNIESRRVSLVPQLTTTSVVDGHFVIMSFRLKSLWAHKFCQCLVVLFYFRLPACNISSYFPCAEYVFVFYASDNFCHSCRTSNWDGATNDWTFPLAKDTTREMMLLRECGEVSLSWLQGI